MVCSERQSNLMYCIWRDIPSILPNLAPNYDVLEVIVYAGNEEHIHMYQLQHVMYISVYTYMSNLIFYNSREQCALRIKIE